METAIEVSVSNLFLDGYMVKVHQGCILFLGKDDEYGRAEKYILWNTKKEEVALEDVRLDWQPVSPKSPYFSIDAGYRKRGVLNTKTGDVFLSEEYQEIKHLRGQYFRVATRAGKTLLLDAENGRVTEGEMNIIGKHAIVNSESIIELSTGKEIFRSEKAVHHLYGPYFIVGGEWNDQDQTIIHFRTSKKVQVPKIDGARTSVKHIGSGKFMLTFRRGLGKTPKHSILTFSTGKMTPAT